MAVAVTNTTAGLSGKTLAVLETAQTWTAAQTFAAITATTGSFSGTLAATGNFSVNTDKFTVVAASGNTAVAGTLGVTGAATFTGGAVVDTISEETSAAGVTIDGVLLKDTTVIANQVVFPATQVASSDVNTLDDYEEGDWTPVIGGSTSESGQTYTRQVGRSVKIGKWVFVWCDVILSAKGTIDGNLRIKGLPHTAATATATFGAGASFFSGLATNWIQVNVSANSASTTLSVFGNQAAATSNLTALTTTDLSDSARFVVSYFYEADA